jgi:hypothetical protein
VPFKGFFDLRTAKDLLAKLESDFVRIEKNPMDAGAAFDFFVTGYHLLEWAYPGDSNKLKRQQIERDSVLLQIASHLANGSKHFEVDPQRHKAVGDTVTRIGAFNSDAFQADAFDVGELRVRLEDNAALKFGKSINVLELARKLMEFWKDRI